MGRLMREFSLTLAFAVLISAVISLSVTPMICARWIGRPPRPRETRLDRWVEPVLEAVAAAYARSLEAALRFWPAMLAVTALAMGLTVWLFMTAPDGFFPEGDSGLIVGHGNAARHVLRHDRGAATPGRRRPSWPIRP